MGGQKESNAPGLWGPPLLGLVGTVIGIVVAFALGDTQPVWKIGLVAVAAGVVVVAIGLLVCEATSRGHRW